MDISDQILESGTEQPEQTMSQAVLTAVAEREGIGVCNLQTPLFDSIDPDALDTLFRNSSGQVTFGYNGYLVTVDSDRNVALSKKTEDGHRTHPGAVDHTE